jgi:hypothetical protein
MNELIDFVKDMFMLNEEEKSPVGLCSFEHNQEKPTPKVAKPKRKRELRLSELME